MNRIEIRTLVVGQLDTNCYLLSQPSTRETWIIDPGDDAEYIEDILRENDLRPSWILLTHGHFDHVMAAADLQINFQIPLSINPEDNFLLGRTRTTADHFLSRGTEPLGVDPLPDRALQPPQTLRLGETNIKVMATPGHTPGSVCFYIQSEMTCLVGDLIFAEGAVGRTDYSYGNQTELVSSIKDILQLPNNTKILSGHGATTTVGEAKRTLHWIF